MLQTEFSDVHWKFNTQPSVLNEEAATAILKASESPKKRKLKVASKDTDKETAEEDKEMKVQGFLEYCSRSRGPAGDFRVLEDEMATLIVKRLEDK